MYGIPNAEESYSQYRDKDDDDTTSQQKKETSEDSSNNQNGVNNFISNNLGRTNLVNNGRKLLMLS